MVTINQPEQLTGTAWRITFSSDAPEPVTFYIYRDGQLVLTTESTEWVATVENGETPLFEILDSENAVPQQGFPARIFLGWYGASDVAKYRIEELVGVTWTVRRTLTNDGRGYFLWQSRALEDSTTFQFRVTPIGTNGNDGTPVTMSVLMVRHPDPPAATFEYDDVAATVTIAAA